MSIQQLSVQSLIDQLGVPPAEVAQDWAYQLLDAGRAEPLPMFEWSQVIVGDDGRLLLSESDLVDPTTDAMAVVRRIQQLLVWSGAPRDQVESLGSCDECQQYLDSKFGRVATDDDSLQVDCSVNASELTNPTFHAGNWNSAVELRDPVTTAKVDSLAKATRGQTPEARKIRWPVLKAAAALAVLAVGGIGYWLTRSPTSSSLVAANLPTNSGASVGSVDEQESEAELPELSNQIESDATELKTLMPEPSVEPEPSSISSNPATNGLPSMQTIAGSLNLNTAPASANSATNTPQADLKVVQTPQEIAANAAPGDDASDDEDVATLLSHGLEMEPAATKPEAENGESQNSSAPFLLDVELPFQVTEVEVKARLRQPQWQLRIVATEEFAVVPTEPQVLREKETLSWQLQPKSVKPRQDQQPTTVAVFAQLDSRNKRDLKWKIVAGCADMPSVALPLNEAKLDQLLTSLQNYQQRLVVNLETLKVAADLPGLPREQRSAISAQRKFVDNETKLVTRARQLIADASMFVSLLDRTLEVHARLVDQIGGQETEVIHFGQPDLPSHANEDSAAGAGSNEATDSMPQS